MNEREMILSFRDEFNAIEIDSDHLHENEDALIGPFKPRRVFIDDKAVGCVDLRKQPDTIDGFVELAYFYVYKPMNGYGSKILKKICALADQYQLEIILDAVPIQGYEHEISEGTLKRFYFDHGFNQSDTPGSNMMTRFPILRS